MRDTDNNIPQDSEAAVTLTVGQLRALIREEIESAALGQNDRGTGDPGALTTRTNLTVKEAADIARLGISTIRLNISQGKLKAQKVGRRVLIKRSELERFLEAHPAGANEN